MGIKLFYQMIYKWANFLNHKMGIKLFYHYLRTWANLFYIFEPEIVLSYNRNMGEFLITK